MTEDIGTLVDALEKYNRAYRSGSPLVGDAEYDVLIERLAEIAPDHPFLTKVEPEVFDGKIEVRHPVPMLSTDKAYSEEQLERFLSRVRKEAGEIGIQDAVFRVTPKLDGLAGRDDGERFASRGNGEIGYEISSAFDKGVLPIGGRGKGIGEIVVMQSYFDTQLAGEFEHPRNMVVGIVASDKLNETARKALTDRAVHFVPYADLAFWEGTGEELLGHMERIIRDLTAGIDYPVDGVVVEVTDEAVKAYMGATAHHYRWQIAVKSKGETAITTVREITWQVGRTGSITPVMEVAPVSLSGATIRRVTAHNAGMVRNRGIGKGATIEIIRSGEVIPKLEKVVQPVEQPEIPDECPSCNRPVYWQNDILKCANESCRAQVQQRISHWFKTLGNADWFGIKTIERLVDGGYDSLEKIYEMTENDFVRLDFGPVQSKNLREALILSRTKSVEDWRFLAALGVPDLGKGDSRKLLAHIPLSSLSEVDAQRIVDIHGFGGVTSRSIASGLRRIRPTLRYLIALGFNLERSPLTLKDHENGSPIAGRRIVFSGKMRHGNREEMQASARRRGAIVQTTVNSKTDYLVCGEGVGAKKIGKAQALNIRILSESAYLEMAEASSDKDA